MATKFMEPGTDATFGLQFLTTTTGTVASDSTQFQTGLRSLKFTSSAGGAVAEFNKGAIVQDAGARVSFYIRFTNLPTGNLDIFLTTTAGDGPNCFGLRVTSGGVLQFTDGVTTQLGTNGSTLSTATWYRLCVSYTITSTTVFSLRLYKDAASDISVTNSGTLNSTGSADVDMGWMSASVGNSLILNIDDIYVDNSAALTDTGNVKVTAKLPAANNVNAFNTVIGANPANRWTNVNERALSETNGWGDNAASTQLENYGLQGASAGDVDISAATIVARTAWIWAKQLVAVAGTPGITNNGTTTAITLTTTSALYTNIVDSASYPSDVAGIGMRSAGVAADATDLFECGMLIAYTPAAGGLTTEYVAPIQEQFGGAMIGRRYV